MNSNEDNASAIAGSCASRATGLSHGSSACGSRNLPVAGTASAIHAR